MFEAYIDCDSGTRQPVTLQDGTLGGQALLSLLTGFNAYCSNPNGNITGGEWFIRLAKHSDRPLCDLVSPMLHAYYSGDWDYADDEYAVFTARMPNMGMQEDEWLATVHEIRNKWVDLGVMADSVRGLVELLESANPPENMAWYHPDRTMDDLVAVYEALVQADADDATEVRIRIT